MAERAAASGELVGWEPLLEGLWRAAGARRLAHALLVRGPAGTGKFSALLRLAQGLLCERGPGPPCGACAPCKRVRSGNHPDLLVLDPTRGTQEEEDEGARETIPVSWITPRSEDGRGTGRREPSIEEFLSLRSLEGGWKVVVVREAERMNQHAQNAFLKTLEEPRPRTLLALECSLTDALLPTVRSRLIELRAPALAPSEIERVLAAVGGQAAERAELLQLARGSPGRALERAGRGAREARAILLEIAAGERDAASGGAALAELPGTFPGRSPLAKARARARLVLDLGLELLADAHRGQALVGDGARAADLRARLESWFEAREDVDANLAPEAALDRALFRLAGALRRAKGGA